MPCDNCGQEFDPIGTRWRCPSCGLKHPCCDGTPLPPMEPNDAHR